MPFTTTKGWPLRMPGVFIGGVLAVLLAIARINIGQVTNRAVRNAVARNLLFLG